MLLALIPTVSRKNNLLVTLRGNLYLELHFVDVQWDLGQQWQYVSLQSLYNC